MTPLLSIHVMTFCRGFQKLSNRQRLEETSCSYSFRDPVHSVSTSVLANAQGNSLALDDVSRSEYIMNRLTALSPTRRLVSIFYIAAIGTLGLSIWFRANTSQRGSLGSRLPTAPAQVFQVYSSPLAGHFDRPPSMMEFFSLIVS